MARGEEGKVLNIKLSGDTGAHIPVKLNGVKCLALIDTGASRSCMSSAQYKLIGSPPLEPLPPGARLRSATGTSMEAWGLTSCLVCIRRKMYAQSFIVCNKMMTNVIVHTVQLIINLAEEPLLLAEGTLLGYYEREDEGDIIVDHEGLFEVNVEKSWEAGELEDKLFPPGGDGFITSPAEVDPRPPIKLRDAEVSQEHRVAFEGLCEEFADVFSQNSADLGKTPLMRMEIPTGDNPPISQRPYGLALRHVQWVQDEIETLERAGVITKSVSPWASPIVIVPKKTSP